jgi:hypothetical protein
MKPGDSYIRAFVLAMLATFDARHADDSAICAE